MAGNFQYYTRNSERRSFAEIEVPSYPGNDLRKEGNWYVGIQSLDPNMFDGDANTVATYKLEVELLPGIEERTVISAEEIAEAEAKDCGRFCMTTEQQKVFAPTKRSGTSFSTTCSSILMVLLPCLSIYIAHL